MDSSPIRQLSDEAIAALRDGDYVRAVAVADQLAAALPDHSVVRAIRAQALLGADVTDEAVAEARRAVELDPQNRYARRLLGLAAWRAGNLGLAQDSLCRAVELSGRSPALLAEYAWFMASQRGPRLAEEAAQEAVRADETSSVAWAALGLAQYRLRRRALELNPNDMYAQAAMATLLQDRRQDAKAEALAELLRDVPGTEAFVESIHEEAKRRQIAKMLVERGALPVPPSVHSPRRIGAWLLATAIMAAGLCVLAQPENPEAIVLCVILPLLLMWLLRRWYE